MWTWKWCNAFKISVCHYNAASFLRKNRLVWIIFKLFINNKKISLRNWQLERPDPTSWARAWGGRCLWTPSSGRTCKDTGPKNQKARAVCPARTNPPRSAPQGIMLSSVGNYECQKNEWNGIYQWCFLNLELLFFFLCFSVLFLFFLVGGIEVRSHHKISLHFLQRNKLLWGWGWG